MAAIWPAFAWPRAALASPIWARAPNIAFSRRVRSRPGNGSSARHQPRIRKRIPSLLSRGSVDGRADLQTSAIAGQCVLPDADKPQPLSRSPGGFRPVYTAILHKHSFFCPALTSDETSRCSQRPSSPGLGFCRPSFRIHCTVFRSSQNIRRWLGRLIRVQKLEASEPLPSLAKVQMCTYRS